MMVAGDMLLLQTNTNTNIYQDSSHAKKLWGMFVLFTTLEN